MFVTTPWVGAIAPSYGMRKFHQIFGQQVLAALCKRHDVLVHIDVRYSDWSFKALIDDILYIVLLHGLISCSGLSQFTPWWYINLSLDIFHTILWYLHVHMVHYDLVPLMMTPHIDLVAYNGFMYWFLLRHGDIVYCMGYDRGKHHV